MRRSEALTSSRRAGASLDDLGAPVEVRRHPSARRLTLRVSRTRRTVIVTVPVQCDLDEAGSFLHRNMEWVRERLDSLPVPVPFRAGVVMPLRGRPHRVRFTGQMSLLGPVRIEAKRGELPELVVDGQLVHAPRRLRDWLFAQAARDLDHCVMKHAHCLGVRPKKIAVRDQQSRWGSCSTTGALSFSWRLILAPSHVLDYVAAHEVAHLAEMNHGPRFWALVRRAMPNMEVAKTWLQGCGMELHRYGTSE